MADHIPGGYTAVAPWVVTEDTGALLDFLTVAFGGEELSRVQVEDGSIGHAETRVGDTVVLAFDRRPDSPAMPSLLRVWVPDADAAMTAAVEAGATLVTPISDQALGQRGGRVRDPFGNMWWVVSQVGTYAETIRIAQASLDAELSGSSAGQVGAPIPASPLTSGASNPGSAEVSRRRDLVDLARGSTHRADSVTVSKAYLDQDAWVNGSITLDELVALSQRTNAVPALRTAAVSDAAAGPTPAGPVRPDTDVVSAFPGVSAWHRSVEVAAAHDLELLAVVAARETQAAVAAAATATLQAAGTARAAQSAADIKVALATAETVRQAAHLLQVHADEDAHVVTSAAAEAASLVAMAVIPGTETVQAERAALLAATIRAAAVTKAEETALAAATVARAAATAAADAAATAADAAMALELQVADTAAAVQAIAIATAQRVAVDNKRAADLVLASGR